MSASGRPSVGVGSPQTYRNAEENNPTYCAFLPNSDSNFPNAYFEQTTEKQQMTIPKEMREQKNDDEDRKLNF